ncbi:hypothetical protein WDU94_003430 [Cyamophila willieti]
MKHELLFHPQISAGDTRLDPFTTPTLQAAHTDPQYWGDDELDPANSDFDIIAPRRAGPGTTMEEFGCHYCGHCGVVPVEQSCQYCIRCKQTKHEWLPDAPTRKLRHKVYKTTARARPLSPKPSTTRERTKHTSRIKSKLKSLINRRGRKPVQPPLSKFSNLKCYRRCCHFRRNASGSSSSTGTGKRVLQEKANAFRKRRDFYFYKHHKYQSDNSS